MRHTDVLHEFHRIEHDVGGAIMEAVLESIDDLPAVIDREAFVRDCGSGDGAAQAFEGVTARYLYGMPRHKYYVPRSTIDE